jgi:cystathionine beta-synthase
MPCQGVERAVLGGDAVQAEYGVRALSGAPDRQLDLPGHPVCTPEALLHGGDYTALTMDYFENITDAVGNTPLVRLGRVEEGEGIEACILAKIEYLNPGGSVKDRPAVKMLEVAEKEGLLEPGGTVVEPTSGNTGAGLALAAAVKGYRCVCVMPDKTSKEKQDLLRALGAEVVITPTGLTPEDPESYYAVAERLAREIPGGFKPGQYENPANPLSHYETTGPEIWEQTGGGITHFVAGMGTCGTITGAGRYLKERNSEIKVIGADPEGSIFSDPDDVHTYAVEGVGEDFYPENFDPEVVDEIFRVTDRESFLMTRRLMREEGLFVGGSCGMAVVAAVRAARRLTDDAVLVVLLPDTGRNYVSKVFDDDWLLENAGITPEDLQRPYRVFEEG